jgi:hypothetical protein
VTELVRRRPVLLIANDNCPLPHQPFLDETFADVGVVGDEVSHDRVVIRSEHQGAAPSGGSA